MSMTLIFTRERSLGSWLIRLFTRSPWSHCMILDGDHIIDSTMRHGGVRRRPVCEALEPCSRAEFVRVRVPHSEAAIEFARSQVGRPYDWSALLGFVWGRDWADDRAWFCNELAEAAMQAGGRRRWRMGLSRITPRMTWEVL